MNINEVVSNKKNFWTSEIKGAQGSHSVCGLTCILNNTNKRHIGTKYEEHCFFVANLSFFKGKIDC